MDNRFTQEQIKLVAAALDHLKGAFKALQDLRKISPNDKGIRIAIDDAVTSSCHVAVEWSHVVAVLAATEPDLLREVGNEFDKF